MIRAQIVGYDQIVARLNALGPKLQKRKHINELAERLCLFAFRLGKLTRLILLISILVPAVAAPVDLFFFPSFLYRTRWSTHPLFRLS